MFWGGIKVFWGGIKSSITVMTSLLPHKKFTWPDFGGIYTPCTPVATPMSRTLFMCIQTVWWTSRGAKKRRRTDDSDSGVEYRTPMRVDKCERNRKEVACDAAAACSGDSSCGGPGGPSKLHRKSTHCTNLSSCTRKDQACRRH